MQRKTFVAFSAEHNTTSTRANQYFHAVREKISIAHSWHHPTARARLPAPAAGPHNTRARTTLRRAPRERMEALSSALAVLTAMITPAVLISACGALILSTSTRLGRVTDRVRLLIDRFEEMMRSQQDEGVEMFEERRAATFDQLDRLTTRSRLLQRSMTVFYLALGVFVATSVGIGLVAAVGQTGYSWVPVVLGLVGSCGLFYGSLLLVFEARLAQAALNAEMDFIWKLGRALDPPDLRQTRSPHFNPLTLRRKP